MSEKYKIDPEIYLETACTLITIHGLIKQELGLGSAVTIADGMATAIKCKESLLVGNIGLEEMAQKELDPISRSSTGIWRSSDSGCTPPSGTALLSATSSTGGRQHVLEEYTGPGLSSAGSITSM